MYPDYVIGMDEYEISFFWMMCKEAEMMRSNELLIKIKIKLT